MQSIPSPVNPPLQLQRKLPFVLIHVASKWQVARSKRHSSTSAICMVENDHNPTLNSLLHSSELTGAADIAIASIATLVHSKKYLCHHIPSQSAPRLVNPGQHMHKKLPSVSKQLACSLQEPVSSKHSLISVEGES